MAVLRHPPSISPSISPHHGIKLTGHSQNQKVVELKNANRRFSIFYFFDRFSNKNYFTKIDSISVSLQSLFFNLERLLEARKPVEIKKARLTKIHSAKAPTLGPVF